MRRKTESERRANRRGWIAGLLAGVILATVVGAWAGPTVFKKMVAGQPAKAADVNKAHQDLADAVDALEKKVTAQAAKIAKLETDPDCPPGYTRDTTAPKSITVCKKGKDEMVKVGSFWVDRYEVSIVDQGVYASGQCSGTGKQYGVSSDDYPTTPGMAFSDSGAGAAPLYACSIKGNKTSAHMTWFQASVACGLAGKHLCTNVEWQLAALGTPDDSTSCNVASPAKEATGNRSTCVSRWGALDMVGNVWEWVAWWSQAGDVDANYSSGAAATPWPSGYGDGKDKTWNINGEAHNGSAWLTGMPAAARLGGHWLDGADAGVFAWRLNLSPTSDSTNTGARCCR